MARIRRLSSLFCKQRELASGSYSDITRGGWALVIAKLDEMRKLLALDLGHRFELGAIRALGHAACGMPLPGLQDRNLVEHAGVDGGGATPVANPRIWALPPVANSRNIA